MPDSVKLDKKDMEILNVLRHDAKLTTKQIARKTLMPATTVHNRIKRLETLGIIKGYAAELDYKKLGKSISAFVLATVNYQFLKEKGMTQHDLAKKITTHDVVEEVAMITGSFDIIVRIRTRDIDEMDSFVTKFLRNLVGIEKTETVIILAAFP